jgi:hypothetical protein
MILSRYPAWSYSIQKTSKFRNCAAWQPCNAFVQP